MGIRYPWQGVAIARLFCVHLVNTDAYMRTLIGVTDTRVDSSSALGGFSQSAALEGFHKSPD